MKKAFLIERTSNLLQCKMPSKYKDEGSSIWTKLMNSKPGQVKQHRFYSV